MPTAELAPADNRLLCDQLFDLVDETESLASDAYRPEKTTHRLAISTTSTCLWKVSPTYGRMTTTKTCPSRAERTGPMQVKKITVSMLRNRYGGSERFWQRRRKCLVRAGLLNKIGYSYFGDLVAIDQAVASGGPDIWHERAQAK